MDPQQESYPCEQCNKVFGRKHHLKRHILTHTRPQLHLTCDQCGTALSQQCYDRGHSGSKEFKCQFCPKSYTRRHRLAAHLKKHHEGNRIKKEPSDQTSPSSPQNIQGPSSISSSTHPSAFPLDENGQSENIQSSALHSAQHTTQDPAGVPPDVMEISDNSENDENHLTSQVIPPTTTRAPNPRTRARAPASGARARARARARGPAARGPAAPAAAPAAANPSRPARQVIPALPKLRRIDERFLLPEHCYTIKLNASIYESLRSYLVKLGYPEDATFPWWRVVNDFMHLYFEHFDHDYPLVHPYALESGNDKASWMLLLAVIAVGSQYSIFSNANLFSAHLADILSEAIARSQPQSPESTILSYVQSVFLNNVILMFGGSQKAQMRLQYERNILVTLARALKVDQSMKTRTSQAPRQWKAWLARESTIRLIHCIFQLECFQLVLFDRQPIFAQHELPDEFPCRQSLWCRRNADNFVHVHQTDQNLPHSPPTQIDVRKANEIMGTLDAFRRNLYLLSLYSDERLFLDKMSYSSIWRSSLLPPITDAPAEEEEVEVEVDLKSTPQGLRSTMFLSMNQVFAAIPTSAKPDYIAARDVIHHVLCLLRQVPLTMLEAFAGWQGEDGEHNMSTLSLKHWMDNNASSARKCLWHAVCVFSTLKVKQRFACHEPLCFMVAFFYIWAFDTFVVAPEMKKPEASTKVIRLLDTREISVWIAEGPNTQLDLVGVGSLTGKESSLRLLTEVCLNFVKRKSWQGLCRGLAYALDRLLQKQTLLDEVTPGDTDNPAP